MKKLSLLIAAAVLGTPFLYLSEASAGGQCSKGVCSSSESTSSSSMLLPGAIERPPPMKVDPKHRPAQSHFNRVERDIDGNIMEEIHYDKKKQLIQINKYRENGKIRTVIEYQKNGHIQSKVTHYDEDGEKSESIEKAAPVDDHFE